MKKLLYVLLLAVTLSLFPMTHAEAVTGLQRVGDYAGLLSQSELADIEAQLAEVSNRQGMDVIFVTVDDYPAEYVTTYGYDAVMYYAADYYDYSGYAADGVLFLLSMADREWTFVTKGFGLRTFTDKGQAFIVDQMAGDLHNDNFYEAVQTYVTWADDFITEAKTGTPYDVGHMPKTPFNYGLWALGAIAIGFVIGLIVAFVNKAALKSVAIKTEAGDYIRPGSFRLTRSADIFMYRHVTRVKREQSKGGGSSSFTSSSGSSHGGSHGHF